MPTKFSRGASDLFQAASGYSRKQGALYGARQEGIIQNSIATLAGKRIKNRTDQSDYDENQRLLTENPDINDPRGFALRNTNPNFHGTTKGLSEIANQAAMRKAIDGLDPNINSGVPGINIQDLANIDPKQLDDFARNPSAIEANEALTGYRDSAADVNVQKASDMLNLAPSNLELNESKISAIEALVDNREAGTELDVEKLSQLIGLGPGKKELNEKKVANEDTKGELLTKKIDLTDERMKDIIMKRGPAILKLLAEVKEKSAGKKLSGDGTRSLFNNLLELVNPKNIVGKREYKPQEAVDMVIALAEANGFDLSGIGLKTKDQSISDLAGEQQVPTQVPVPTSIPATPPQADDRGAWQMFKDYFGDQSKPTRDESITQLGEILKKETPAQVRATLKQARKNKDQAVIAVIEAEMKRRGLK